MDKNKVKSICSITESLHDETTKVYESLMDEDTQNASDSIDVMIESLKHLKSNLQTDDF